MKKFFLLMLLFSIYFGFVFGSKLSDELSGLIETIDENEKTDVIVWLTEPDDWGQQRAFLENMRGDERKRMAVVWLKEFYFRHSDPVVDIVNDYENAGKAIFDKDLWGGFSFSMSATGAVIEAVAEHPRVRAILLDKPIDARFMLPYDVRNPYERFLRITVHYTPPDICAASMVYAWQLTKINADDAWSSGYNGEDVIIAILDSGTDLDHADLAGRLWTNTGETPGNFSDDDGNGYTDDIHGYDFYNGDGNPEDSPSDVHHGTMCAGMAVGDGSGGTNTGAAPGAKLMTLRTSNGNSFCGSSDEVDAFDYAVENGADVISISYGLYPDDGGKVWYRYYITGIFGAAGIPVFVAAGNGDPDGGHYATPYDISTPADIPAPWYSAASSDPPGPVIGVGATTMGDAVADFSSYGPTVWDAHEYGIDYDDYPGGLMKPDISAPGNLIQTTTYGGGYAYEFGTSFSCPLTAGAAAVMLSKNGELTPREIDSIMEAGAVDIDAAGRDNNSGAGRLDLQASLDMVSGKAIAIDSIRIDDPAGDNDKNLDPGETGNILVYLRNAGSIAAPGVQVNVTLVSNPNIGIVDGSSSYGTMNPGVEQSNAADPISFSVSPLALYTEYCMCYYNVTDGAGYFHADSFSFRVGIYPLQSIVHDTLGTLYISYTNFALMGYYGGMAWPWPTDSSNMIYAADIMVGASSAYVADGFEDFWPLDSIWQYEGGVAADRESYTAFIDTTNDFYIRQYAYQWRSAPNNDFIIFFFKVFNMSLSPMSNVYTSFYADFDINPYDTNYAIHDDANKWSYMYYSAAGTHTGIVALDGYARGSVVDNPAYVYEEGMGWTDAVKWGFLSGTYSDYNGTNPKDWSVILSFGPYTLPAAGPIATRTARTLDRPHETYAAAIVVGSNLADFETNAEQAKTTYDAYSTSLDVKDGGAKPDVIALFGAHPNPFNSATEISYAITEPGDIKIGIIDISGKIIREFDEGERSIGMYSVRWDGLDKSGNNMPSGLYFARLTTGNTELVRKLFLIK